MTRSIFNIVLIVSFLFLSVLIITPLIADIQYNAAQGLVSRQQLEKAETRFEEVIRISPFNTEHLAGFGGYLFLRSAHQKGMVRVFWLERAKELYERALKLNPRNAEYALNMGLTDLKLGHTEEAFNYFKEALKNDPNGFNISYSVGYSGMRIWNFLDKDKKGLVLNTLRHALELRSSYGVYIYPHTWKYVKDFSILRNISPNKLAQQKILYDFILQTPVLYSFRKEQMDVVNFYRRKEESEEFERERLDRSNYLNTLKKSVLKNRQLTEMISQKEWQGKSNDGYNVIVDGYMYWNGTIYAIVLLKPGDVTFSIEAQKFLVIKTENTQDLKFYPYMVVKLDDQEIGAAFVPSDEWKEYQFSTKTDGGLKVLSISFINDIYDPAKGEDRNLCIGSVKISYK